MPEHDAELIQRLMALAAERRASDQAEFWALAARLRAATADRRHTPAADLVREGRDER